MKKDELVPLSKWTRPAALEKAGELDRLWAKWLGPSTEYKMVREEKVTPLTESSSRCCP